MGIADFKVTCDRIGERGEVALVRVFGEIDVYSFAIMRDVFREEVLRAEELPEHVGLELSEVDYLDSCGIGAFAGLLKQLRERRPEAMVGIIAASERVKKIFRITGLRNVFPVLGTVEEFLDLTARPETYMEVWERAWGPEQAPTEEWDGEDFDDGE